ncbi:unnamed protein product [Ceutorhynchus assimilis]|uniref:Myb/SANT-like DNA-binding domain-containing protein n=1 Tax=Ceutorhynchus assimilis TaxID=467358 RepID=A0A9N9MYF5_9CUCU|nr:unnamed protein product [Ceutorhynchus assimilis]
MSVGNKQHSNGVSFLINGKHLTFFECNEVCVLLIEEVEKRKGKTKEFSRETTTVLLDIRVSEKFKKLFNDKKNSKSQLWNKIAQEMVIMGFDLGDKMGEKCRQKFANLQKSYIAFKNNGRQTGAGAIDKPWYYDLIDGILRDKDTQIRDRSMDLLFAQPSTSTD